MEVRARRWWSAWLVSFCDSVHRQRRQRSESAMARWSSRDTTSCEVKCVWNELRNDVFRNSFEGAEMSCGKTRSTTIFRKWVAEWRVPQLSSESREQLQNTWFCNSFRHLQWVAMCLMNKMRVYNVYRLLNLD